LPLRIFDKTDESIPNNLENARSEYFGLRRILLRSSCCKNILKSAGARCFLLSSNCIGGERYLKLTRSAIQKRLKLRLIKKDARLLPKLNLGSLGKAACFCLWEQLTPCPNREEEIPIYEKNNHSCCFGSICDECLC